MSTASLIAQLQAAGGTIKTAHGRLLVEAPPGVVTAELRAQLVKHKSELISVLDKSHVGSHEDPSVTSALREVTDLLASAYRRSSTVQQVGESRAQGSGNKELANSPRSSVHGGVP